jgi:hypothetical protein
LYRAVTYLPPIPLGALACLTWRHAPALIHAKPAKRWPTARPSNAVAALGGGSGPACVSWGCSRGAIG